MGYGQIAEAGGAMPFDAAQFASWWEARRGHTIQGLLELIEIPTTSPDEELCYPWLEARVKELGGSVQIEPPPGDLAEHPEFTVTEFSARARSNLRARFPHPDPGAPRLLLNAHVDVVPADDFPAAFSPVLHDGEIVGRGAADTKNNIAMTFAALELLGDLEIPPAFDLTVDFVVEEEIGGSGTLASILNGCEADEVVVLEPTGLEILHGHRGCLSFEVEVEGVAGHMGGTEGLSAIDGAVEVIGALKRLEAEMREAASAKPLFDSPVSLTPVNVGAIHGGQWHGSFPRRCQLRANAGFLPPDDVAAVASRIERTVAELPEPWNERCRVTYSGIHNEAYVIDSATPLVGRLVGCGRRQGVETGRPRVWEASCDARFYSRLLDLPVVVFGSGDLGAAHASDERLSLTQFSAGVRMLADFLATLPAEGA